MIAPGRHITDVKFVQVKKYILLFTALLLSLGCYCQTTGKKTKDSVPGLDANRVLSEIRQEVARINADSALLKVKRRDVEEESTEGGEIKRYYLGNNLCKTIATFYGETGKVVREYYFLNGAILFLFTRESFYNVPMYYKNSRVNKVVENRYYFKDGKLVRWVKGKKIMETALYPSAQSDILSDLKEFL